MTTVRFINHFCFSPLKRRIHSKHLICLSTSPCEPGHCLTADSFPIFNPFQLLYLPREKRQLLHQVSHVGWKSDVRERKMGKSQYLGQVGFWCGSSKVTLYASPDTEQGFGTHSGQHFPGVTIITSS